MSQPLSFKLTPDYHVLIEATILEEGTSPFQQWQMFHNDTLGVTMALDNCIMVCEKDEHQYHELIVHPNCLMLDNYREALIIGGGDGLCAKRVLQYPFTKITQVEIDKKVTDLSEKYFSELLGATLTNPRLTLHFEDALKFIPNSSTYDFISLDLTDPVDDERASTPLYSIDFFLKCKEHLTKEGIMVVQIGCPYFMRQHFKNQYRVLKSLFKHHVLYGQFMRCYGMHQYFMAVSNHVQLEHIDTMSIENKINSLGINNLKLYDAQLHQSMIIPNKEIVQILNL